MKYFDEPSVKITADELKQHIGKPIKFLRKKDIDHSGRGMFFPRYGKIQSIFRGQIELENGEIDSIKDYIEIVLQ